MKQLLFHSFITRGTEDGHSSVAYLSFSVSVWRPDNMDSECRYKVGVPNKVDECILDAVIIHYIF